MALRMLFMLMAFVLFITSVSSNLDGYGSPVMAPAPAPKPPAIPYVQRKECPSLCDGRCSKHSRPNQCKRVCTTCCLRCKCVPPGTAGNREVCGKCYTDMLTHGDKIKCP